MKRFLLLLTTALLSLFASACTHPSANGPQMIAIAGARLEPGEGKPVIDYSIVIIEGTKFREVGPQTSVRMPKEAQIIDGLGHTIVPNGNAIEPGQPANLILKGPKGRTMREGQWQ
jgi:hypothetical protein